MTPAQAYSRKFSLEEEETESSGSQGGSGSAHSQAHLVSTATAPHKPPRQGKYRLPRRTSLTSEGDVDADHMEIVPVAHNNKNRKENSKGQRSGSQTRADDSPKSSLRDYVIRSSQRYSINEPKRDHRVEAKAKADRELMESLENKKPRAALMTSSLRHHRKSFRKHARHHHHQNGSALPLQRSRSERSGLENAGFTLQPKDNSPKLYPDGILKKSSASIDGTSSDDEYLVQSRRQRKFLKRAAHAQGALRLSSQRVSAGGATDESALDKPSWVVTAAK